MAPKALLESIAFIACPGVEEVVSKSPTLIQPKLCIYFAENLANECDRNSILINRVSTKNNSWFTISGS
jgi:hypothetical protein